jgi:hypothetical protein
MAILRPIAQILAERAREALDIAYQGLVDTVSDDPRGWVLAPDPEPITVPCREGKSLHSPVKSRSYVKRKFYGRWSEL